MISERIRKMRKAFVEEKIQKKYWQEETDHYVLAREFSRQKEDSIDRATERLLFVLDHEKPVVFPDEKIAFLRTVRTIPELYTEEEAKEIARKHRIHEKGDVCNINVDYSMLLGVGFDAKKAELRDRIADFRQRGKEKEAHYLSQQIRILSSVEDLVDRYRKEAEKVGNTTVASSLSHVPSGRATSWLEAMQFFRIIHYVMWCGRNYHNTLGRMDQYLYPYFHHDMEAGLYTKEQAQELLEEFFLTFNRDSDLYPGMQQGDNGQSLVLGGIGPDGKDSYNELSELCMLSSLDLKVIDPKINLRVNKNTPFSLYVLGTKMTRQGLGFPQYSNDDVVIPGLEKLGYSHEDACSYVVAACWEFIIPNKAMDIPNIDALSFAGAVEKACFDFLESSPTYEEFEKHVDEQIEKDAASICEHTKGVFLYPAPFLSLMMTGCEETGRDVSLGCVYNNYGIHGTGIATAADSLAVIKKYVYGDKSIGKAHLLQCLHDDFKSDPILCNNLRYRAPKMGNDDDFVDSIATHLLDQFASVLKGKKNDRGGIFRAGTGSAMYYVWHAAKLPATADGRHSGEGLPANYSPSLFCRSFGPISIIKSFSKQHLENAINGGPLTLEVHDTVFKTEESLEKVAMLVKSYIDLGGHQLQINTVNREQLLDAQKHPEKYRNLIVRVWGWSGYFVELDKCYQDHIIQRMELS
ncbi:MAG: pyruvate formate lyase family protein [Sphaerochaetaceae bacterium]